MKQGEVNNRKKHRLTLDLSLHLLCTHETLNLLNVGSISFKRISGGKKTVPSFGCLPSPVLFKKVASIEATFF